MELLTEPRVLNAAVTAACVSTAACYPRLALWPARPLPIWVLLVVLLMVTTVLWAFVFAWHGPYTERPVFARQFKPRDWSVATACGLAGAVLLLLLVDPVFRALTPQDYPTSVKSWLAMTLFGLALEPVFLCFAPFAFFVRLFQSPRAAAALTVLWGLFVMYLKISSSRVPLGVALVFELALLRLVFTSLAVWFYLRGGVWLVVYCGAWFHVRHLPMLLAQN